MAARIAEHITQKLIIASIIEEGDRELYCYGFFLLTTRLFFFLVTAATGLIAGVLLESILFYTVFMLLRTYAGGMHAKTETACTILTSIVLSASVFGIRIIELSNRQAIISVMLVISVLSILLLSPLDSNEKPLGVQEKKHYHRICLLFTFVFISLAFLAKILFLNELVSAIACGLFLESMLLITGYFCRKA